MLRISNIETITDKNNIAETIPKIMKKVEPILQKRRTLHEKYSRGANGSNLMFSDGNKDTIVSYEKFLTDIASGYLSGKPIYSVSSVMDDEKANLLNKILDKKTRDKDYKKEMEILIDYIVNYNDDLTENHDLIHDILELTSCYEVLYENENNEIVYSKYDPLNTCAIWDYNTPANLLAIVRIWDEVDINEKTIKKCEITDKYGSHTYKTNEQYKEVEEEDNNNHFWGDVPAIAVETDYAIFEPCEDIIESYEQLIQNVRNTYQYNDSDCKLKFSGYSPENPLTISEMVELDDGTYKEIIKLNPARVEEDNYIEKAKTLYVQEGGDVDYITKPLDSNGAVEVLKVYINLIFQLAGIPNTTDLAFNSADLNASAIDRKFYIMNMMTANVISQLKKAYQRRWELIFNRINLKKSTDYDFRDIDIDIPKNLPANDDERIDSTLKLANYISEQTMLERLGFNYLEEKAKKDNESEDNIFTNMENIKSASNKFQAEENDKEIEVEEETETIEEDIEK